MKESEFVGKTLNRIRLLLPNCEIIRTDPSYQQGLPDYFVLYNHHWAALEFKKSANAERQPNQDYFIERFGTMGFAAYVYPDNVEEILHELAQTFESSGGACVPQP